MAPSRSFYAEEKDIAFSQVPVEKASVPVEEDTIKKEFVSGYEVDRSSFLEEHTKVLRGKLNTQLSIVTAEYNNLRSAAKNEWDNAINKITSVYDPEDKFLPNFNYALTIMLSGSILASKSSLPVRFITPVVFGTAAFKFFLPRTFANTCNAVMNYEANNYPDVLSFQRSIKDSLQQLEKQGCDLQRDANEQLVKLVHDVRVSLTK